MADVTTVFAAKDESFAKTVDNLQNRLTGFQSQTSSFSDKVGAMAGAFARFAGPIAAMGAAFLGARSAVQAFTDAINVGGKLAELSQRTGESAGNLAILQRAFENAGSSADAVGPMLNRLQRFMIEGADGGKAQSEAMNKLGMSFSDLAGKTPLEQMQLLAQRISDIPDPAQRSALAMQIFGRSGGELLPLLRNMGSEIDNARAQLGSYPEAVDRAAKALDGIGDSFKAITTKAREFVTGALVNIAPELERALDTISKMDFTRLGMNLSDAFSKAYNFFRGLWANPVEIFKLLGDYLNATFRQAGDSLLSAFLTAGNALFNLLKNIVNSGAFTQLGNVLANAFWLAVSKFNLAMFDAIESVVEFFGRLWNSVTSQGVQGLATKLLDVVRFFASDFIQAMTNPAAFIANKLASALTGATKSSSEEYRFAFDRATGSYIAKAREGLNAVADGSGKRLEQSASAFSSLIVDAAAKTAANAKIVEVNLFGGAQAVAAVNEKVAAIAEAGAKFREPMQESTELSEQIKEDLVTLPKSGLTLKEALSKSFPLAAMLKDEARAMAQQGQLFASSIKDAKIDAKATSDLFKGLSDRMSTAVNATSAMLDKMREAFSFGRDTTKEFYEKAKQAGMNINEATKAAADYASRRNEADRDLMSNFHKVRLAEEQKERTLAAAQRADDAKAHATAFKLRLRAEADYTKKLEQLRPDIEKATERAKRLLEEGGEAVKDSAEPVGKGGAAAGSDMADGGSAAGQALTDAADALKGVVDNINQQLALENTLQLCKDFLQSIDEKLPQHALV